MFKCRHRAVYYLNEAYSGKEDVATRIDSPSKVNPFIENIKEEDENNSVEEKLERGCTPPKSTTEWTRKIWMCMLLLLQLH